MFSPRFVSSCLRQKILPTCNPSDTPHSSALELVPRCGLQFLATTGSQNAFPPTDASNYYNKVAHCRQDLLTTSGVVLSHFHCRYPTSVSKHGIVQSSKKDIINVAGPRGPPNFLSTVVSTGPIQHERTTELFGYLLEP